MVCCWFLFLLLISFETKKSNMPEEKQEKLWDQTVRLDPVQFKDLLTAMAHIVEGQMKLADRLAKIEGELKLIRMEISELKKEKVK